MISLNLTRAVSACNGFAIQVANAHRPQRVPMSGLRRLAVEITLIFGSGATPRAFQGGGTGAVCSAGIREPTITALTVPHRRNR
jgi:hypothetical protein